MQTFKSIIQLTQFFKDDATCRAHLEEIVWGGKPVCPHCGHERSYKFKSGKVYKCANPACYKKFTVTVGTIFDSAKMPLQKWFVAMFLMTSNKKGISSYQLAKHINVTQKTAWFMLCRIRKAAGNGGFRVMTGNVEMDEVYIGGKHRVPQFIQQMPKEEKESRREELKRINPVKRKEPVFAIVERNGEVIVKHLKGNLSQGIVNTVRAHVDTDSFIHTDDSKLYTDLDFSYARFPVVHSKGEFVRGNIHTNTVEGFFSHFKRTIYGTYHFCTPKHLQRYCDEIGYRYSTRNMKEDERFRHCLKQSGVVLRHKDLIANPKIEYPELPEKSDLGTIKPKEL